MKATGAVLGLALFMLVCVWILVDSRLLRRRPCKPLRREDMEAGFIPGARSMPSAGALFLGLSAVLFLLAINEYLHPSVAPFSGKGAMLKTLAVQALGSRGVSSFYAAVGVLLLVLGLASRKR